jgi:hypothetical protein
MASAGGERGLSDWRLTRPGRTKWSLRRRLRGLARFRMSFEVYKLGMMKDTHGIDRSEH